jgi:hypothetical protein
MQSRNSRKKPLTITNNRRHVSLQRTAQVQIKTELQASTETKQSEIIFGCNKTNSTIQNINKAEVTYPSSGSIRVEYLNEFWQAGS